MKQRELFGASKLSEDELDSLYDDVHGGNVVTIHRWELCGLLDGLLTAQAELECALRHEQELKADVGTATIDGLREAVRDIRAFAETTNAGYVVGTQAAVNALRAVADALTEKADALEADVSSLPVTEVVNRTEST